MVSVSRTVKADAEGPAVLADAAAVDDHVIVAAAGAVQWRVEGPLASVT